MEKIKAKLQFKATRKQKLILSVIFGIALLTALANVFYVVASWLNYHKFVFRPIVTSQDTETGFQVNFNKPIEIVEVEEPKPIVEYVFVGQEELDKLVKDSSNPDIAEYIVEKFGPTQASVALAVAKAESGMREDAININTNGTIDVGVYQINYQSHKNREACQLKKLVDAKSNVDCAYELWKEQGWGIWVAYANSSYLAHVN